MEIDCVDLLSQWLRFVYLYKRDVSNLEKNELNPKPGWLQVIEFLRPNLHVCCLQVSVCCMSISFEICVI